MTVDTKLRTAAKDLTQALDAPSPTLPRRPRLAPVAVAAAVVVTGVVGVLAWPDESPTGEEAVSAAIVSDGTSPPWALAEDAPEGIVLETATIFPWVILEDCVGCVDLAILPTNSLPMGNTPFMFISVERNPSTDRADTEADAVRVRGRDAVIEAGDKGRVLSWNETAEIGLTITWSGYEQEQVIAVSTLR